MRNLKKVVALVAVFAMLVSSVAFGQTFSDVADDANYYEAIEMLNGLNILTGDDQDGDGVMDFRPEDTITRAEVAAVISRIQGINSAAQTDTVFTDVTASHWASGYVAQAAGQGIVNGYGDGTFGPENPVLYEQAVKMIVEALGYAPFVAENGGYYAGHMTAASRYGVLEGVIGGTIGKEATRGQVAQMLYNAVDTPLMERAAYGDEASYVINNGFSAGAYGASNFITLLKRDLKVKKFEGYVTENQFTDYTTRKTIDTDKVETIDITFDASQVNSDYEVSQIKTLLVGDTNAAELIGMHVTGYAKATGISGQYELIAITPTSLNETVSFTLDNYANYNTGVVEYFTDKANGIKTKATLTTEAIFVNGVALESARSIAGDGTVTWTPATVFGTIVQTNSPYSGKVTLIDNDTNAGYDVIKLEIAASGVVDTVNAAGRVAFKQAVAAPNTGAGRLSMIFDDEDKQTIIKLTKNGEEIDYTELKEWDVISARWNAYNGLIYAEVLDSTVVEGKVAQTKKSDTSALLISAVNTAVVIDGVAYDVAPSAYNSTAIKLGAAGLFYIDAYGKIVAYDKNGTASASDNYAYVLAATKTVDDWGKLNVRVLLLAKDGNVYEAYLAEEVEIPNAPASFTTNTFVESGAFVTTAPTSDVYEIADFALDTTSASATALNETANGAVNFATALQNQLITYEANAAGEIDAIGFATTNPDTAEQKGFLYQHIAGTTPSGMGAVPAYDEEDKEIKLSGKTANVTADTLVFYINGTAGSVTALGDTDAASKTASKVVTGASIGSIDQNKYVAVYDVDNNDDAAVVVIFGMNAGISASSNVAVMAADAGTAYVDGEKVAVVEFYMGGELKTAYADPNLQNANVLQGAEEGDVFKFAFNADGTVITAIDKYIDYAGYGYVDVTTDATVTPALTAPLNKVAGGTSVVFGPAIKYNSATKRITLAGWDSTLGSEHWDVDGTAVTTETVKASEANVYVFDQNKLANKVYVADASDIYVDEDIVDTTKGFIGTDDKLKAGKVVKTNLGGNILTAGDYVEGLLDFVAAFKNADGDVIDVVIYKPYDFGVWYAE